MKYYSKTTMQNWTKQELIKHIECLQYNLKCEEDLNNHMYRIISVVEKKNPKFEEAINEILDVWEKYSGTRYEEIEQ